ncbi:AAA family ATPase [Peribacillus psychrosaccharolyticus]|uniref:AAA family ATPase n=2 Tax=Peribacillus psychrosaccharolyticus TaxID=1407 RepID=A0A974S365_PERPY|nr:AAA family ATPase [Peribacillus psychrosaccharolyticus]MEC2057846.1 AAA family ATPase [Peribacillus psychrosaccharolyticus]MED3744537.1 AAA family ATPase [Peribacillus psychrosaccharolyticus]QQT02665.1 AAA family ATPase [Peribacillus psychrosaccharolyticus]
MSKILPFVILSFVILAGITWYAMDKSQVTTIPFSSVENTIKAQEGQNVSIKEKPNGKLVISTADGTYVSHIPPNSQMVNKLVSTYNIDYLYSSTNTYSLWILGGLAGLLIAAVITIQKKSKGGIGIKGKSKSAISTARPLPSITLADVGGLQPEIKQEILQTLTTLKEPERSAKIGIKPPQGILLYGPPGTGKTLLAQAIAKELGANFFSTSGSAFNEMFVGVGASRVRNLFQNARKQTPAVIFIDEVDALAGRRKQNGGEEGEKTLTELLVQLDGGHSNEGILFVAATNRKDMLDEAFLRPGRIDFSFQVPLPDTTGRKEIIEIHAKGKQLSLEVLASLDKLAESTSGFSGADLSSLFETASRRALRNGQDLIEKDDIDYAIDRTVLGSTSRSLNDPDTKRRVAIHESGHALIAALTKPGSVRKATIIPRGEALGYVAPIPKELHLATASELLDQVKMIVAGGVAERMYLGEHSVGVGGDVQQAKQLLEQMVDTGLLQDGFTLTFNKVEKEQKMQALFTQAIQETESLIDLNRPQYEELVEVLLKKETIDGTEVQLIVDSQEAKVLSFS